MRSLSVVVIFGLVLFSLGCGADDKQESEQNDQSSSRDSESDESMQLTTVENIMRLGQSVEQYIMDFNRIGAPKVADVNLLQTIFLATEINWHSFIVKDGWGKDLIYQAESTIGSKNYTIMSLGSDGKPGPAVLIRGVVRHFEEDIIWVQGRFQQRPVGGQTSRR